jgi:hypothetical protein
MKKRTITLWKKSVMVILLVNTLFLGIFVVGYSDIFAKAKQKPDDLNENKIKAMVDPAIYKPGDGNLTIYGSCLDSNSHPLSGATAKLNVYNRSQEKVVDNVTMSEMFTGKFNFSTTAPSSQGNYFVEINCSKSGDYALAYSNFQVVIPTGYIDWNDCEYFSEQVQSTTVYLSCTAGYTLVAMTCWHGAAGDSSYNNPDGHCQLSDVNTLKIYSDVNQEMWGGTIKCCEYVSA